MFELMFGCIGVVVVWAARLTKNRLVEEIVRGAAVFSAMAGLTAAAAHAGPKDTWILWMAVGVLGLLVCINLPSRLPLGGRPEEDGE